MTLVIEQPVRRQTDRIFFTGMAVVSAAAVVLGFAPTYFVRSATLPPLTLLYHLHGALFTAWIALFIVQTSLVASGRPDIHRKLGIAGALLAAAVFVMGVVVSIETLRRNAGLGGAVDPRMFLAIPLGDVIAFGVLVTAAIVLRRRPEAHKRLMLLATISLLTAAVGRGLVQLHAAGPVTLFAGTDIFVATVILYDFASRGRVHPATLWGAGMVALFKPALLLLAATPAWLAFADALR